MILHLLLCARPRIWRSVCLAIFAIAVAHSTAQSSEVTYLKTAGPEHLEYVVALEPKDRPAAERLLTPALALVMTVPPSGFSITRSPGDRFDFVIDVTNSEQARSDLTAMFGASAAGSTLSFTTYDKRTGRYAVRLIWDRIVQMKNNRGVLVDHPHALARLVSTLAREIYGRLPKLPVSPTPKVGEAQNAAALNPTVQRDLYRASAETMARIVAHSKFSTLDPRDQADFLEAKSVEARVAAIWAANVESRVGGAKVFAFPARRCEVNFRAEPSN